MHIKNFSHHRRLDPLPIGAYAQAMKSQTSPNCREDEKAKKLSERIRKIQDKVNRPKPEAA